MVQIIIWIITIIKIVSIVFNTRFTYVDKQRTVNNFNGNYNNYSNNNMNNINELFSNISIVYRIPIQAIRFYYFFYCLLFMNIFMKFSFLLAKIIKNIWKIIDSYYGIVFFIIF
jgi:hypothetical protein